VVESILEKNPKVKRLFEKLANELTSVRATILELYRASLDVWCPGWEKIAKSNRTSLTNRALKMEASIKESMVARGYNRRALTSYLYGAFEEILAGMKGASMRPISIPKRREMMDDIASGTSPEQAKKKVMDRRESKFVRLTFFSFRPPGDTEDFSEYLTELEDALKAFLVNWNVQVSLKRKPENGRKATKAATAKPTTPTTPTKKPSIWAT
jgi:hypothetical protein